MAEELDIFSGANLNTTLLGGSKIASTVLNFTAMDVDYEKLKLQADYQDNVASNMQLQSQQQANLMREQFSEAVGGYTYGQSRRHVKVGEGGGNIEMSSEAFGKDIAQLQKNAAYQADLLRVDANRIRAGAESIKDAKFWYKISDLISGFGAAGAVFDKYKKTIGPELPPKKEEIPVKPGEVPKPTDKKIPIEEPKISQVTTELLKPEIKEQPVKPNIREMKPEVKREIDKLVKEGKDPRAISNKLNITEQEAKDYIASVKTITLVNNPMLVAKVEKNTAIPEIKIQPIQDAIDKGMTDKQVYALLKKEIKGLQVGDVKYVRTLIKRARA